MAGTLMIQGTSSSAGKSLTVTGLVRLFRQDGYSVVPFKAQNMSLNSYPAIEGGEIGRAQVAQAEAAGLPPSIYMNPVLLKPTTDVGAQVIVLGKPIAHMGAREYHEFKSSLLPVVKESLDRLRSEYDLVVIEGAGSPAEINLRENDIVNMAVAHLADAPVVLVADIDRGGVFASIYGTWALLDDADRARLKAFIVNRFRGDESILEPGIREIEERTGMRCLGVMPYLRDVGVDDEDSVSLDEAAEAASRGPRDAEGWPLGEGPRVAVVRLPRISNFTDFRPLETCGLFRVRYAEHPEELRRRRPGHPPRDEEHGGRPARAAGPRVRRRPAGAPGLRGPRPGGLRRLPDAGGAHPGPRRRGERPGGGARGWACCRSPPPSKRRR